MVSKPVMQSRRVNILLSRRADIHRSFAVFLDHSCSNAENADKSKDWCVMSGKPGQLCCLQGGLMIH